LNDLTIYKGYAPEALVADARGQGSRVSFMRRYEPDTYTAFIRRTLFLQKCAAVGDPTLLVDHADLAMEPFRTRMFTRIAAGLGAKVIGTWMGITPQEFPENPGPGIGNWAGDVLVLAWSRGQIQSPDREPRPQPNWPFISSCNYGVATWLAKQLDEAVVPETSLYWMNTCSWKDGVRADEPADATLSRPWKAVVALGHDAAEWAAKNGLPVDYVAKHPTFWWRDNPGTPYPFVDFLVEATCK
jgi:hypothetical protein